jgi:predicted dehydrogenase
VRVLLTGRGSIAQRHARHLRALIPGLELAVVSGSGEVDAVFGPCQVVTNFAQGMAWLPQAVVIANISSRHADELLACLDTGLPCLVEKPLVISRDGLERVQQMLGHKTSTKTVVGCNLRYLPALQILRAALRGGDAVKVVRAQLEVGQDLAQWRPTRDLQSSYSAHAGQGGGVVFDLVHEIDMANWLLGPLQVHAAVGGHFGPLPISSDDVHVALLKTSAGAPVTVSLDYISRKAVRRYSMVTAAGTWDFDLMAKRLTFSDKKGVQVLTDKAEDFDVANSYSLQMQDWLKAISQTGHAVLSTLEDALQSTRLMLDMKQAAKPL